MAIPGAGCLPAWCGLDHAAAGRAYYVLMSALIGSVAIETAARGGTDPRVADRLAEALQLGLPHLVQAAPALLGQLSEDAFQSVIDPILDALLGSG